MYFQSVVVGSAGPMIDCISSILSIESVAIACDARIRHCIGKGCLCLMVNVQAVSEELPVSSLLGSCRSVK
jgi:hypothetical protein